MPREPSITVSPGERFGKGTVTDPEVRAGTTRRRCARLRCDCGTEYLAPLYELTKRDRYQSCHACATIKHVAFTGQRFGGAVITDPEIRVSSGRGTYRYARLRCDCGTEYLSPVSALYQGYSRTCPACSDREKGRKRRRVGGKVQKVRNGYTVMLYVGHYKNRREAEEAARRSRAVLIPDVKDRPAVTAL